MFNQSGGQRGGVMIKNGTKKELKITIYIVIADFDVNISGTAQPGMLKF